MASPTRPFPLRSLLLRFGMLTAASAIAVSVALVVLLDSFERQRVAMIEVQATRAVREAARDLQRLFFEVVGDLGIISRLPAVRTAVDQPSEAHWRAVAEQLEGFSVEYGRYPSIRVLDQNGGSVASFPTVGATSSSPAALSSTLAALLVQQRQLVVMPLVWQGSRALLPVARPLLDVAGNPRFELWVDIQLNRTFEGIATILQVPELKAEAWILDAGGRVISAPPAQGSRQQPFNLIQRFPTLRTALAEQASGRLLGPQGLFVYQAIAPLKPGPIAAPGAHLGGDLHADRLVWMLVMRVPPDQLHRGSLLASPQGQVLIGGLYLAAVLASGLLAYSQCLAQQRQLEADRHAHELWRLSSTDPLTGLLNRRRFEELATYEIARSQRTGAPLALLLLDIDHFKQVNDGFGHGTGDLVLRAFAEATQSALREIDTIARWGGEEFAVLMPQTGQQPAIAVAERVRRMAEAMAVMPRSSLSDATKPVHITVSIGVVVMEACELSLEAMLHLADQGLYAAKIAGRNCVAVLQGPGQKPCIVPA
jgi:diguanylate cyclase (GGDEF)-like protein